MKYLGYVKGGKHILETGGGGILEKRDQGFNYKIVVRITRRGRRRVSKMV